MASVVLGAVLAGCEPEARAPVSEPLRSASFDVADRAPARRNSAQPSIPLPSAALLKREREPGCETTKSSAPPPDAPRSKAELAGLKVAGLGPVSAHGGLSHAQVRSMSATAAMAQADANADLALRIKLEYEVECYRRAEARVRARLLQLQGSVQETVRAIKRQDADILPP